METSACGRYTWSTVTIKDLPGDNPPGYPNPKPGPLPAAFPAVIQIVPPPAGLRIR